MCQLKTIRPVLLHAVELEDAVCVGVAVTDGVMVGVTVDVSVVVGVMVDVGVGGSTRTLIANAELLLNGSVEIAVTTSPPTRPAGAKLQVPALTVAEPT